MAQPAVAVQGDVRLSSPLKGFCFHFQGQNVQGPCSSPERVQVLRQSQIPESGLGAAQGGLDPAVREGFWGLSHCRPAREMEVAQLGSAGSEGQDWGSAGESSISQATGEGFKNPSLQSLNPPPKRPIQATNTTWKQSLIRHSSPSQRGATQPRRS